MSEKHFLLQQRNDKKHRKLVRSPDKLSPCDLEAALNPSFFSTSANVFTSNRSSPTKSYNDQFTSSHKQQQMQQSNASSRPTQLPSPISSADDAKNHHSNSSTLPPSSSTPSIALYRKPSITIKYSRDEGSRSEMSHQSSLAFHQQISKSIDSTHPFSISTEQADQMSNNFLNNFSTVAPGCCRTNNVNFSPFKQHQKQLLDQKSTDSNLFNLNDENSCANEIMIEQQQTNFEHSPTSQSLNLNLINQSQNTASNQIGFSSNNPFLNDDFDVITTHEDEGGGEKLRNFFKMDSSDSELLFFPTDDSVLTPLKNDSVDDDFNDSQLLKNKREKFSNASTMKICLVVSPPTNKLFQVSIFAHRVIEHIRIEKIYNGVLQLSFYCFVQL